MGVKAVLRIAYSNQKLIDISHVNYLDKYFVINVLVELIA
jgi:hypothetical protein